MKLKIIFLITILLKSFNSSFRTCKADLLRSFNYESRLTPNRRNSLCPLIANNCCTNLDIMKMHKTWNIKTKKQLQKKYKKNKFYLKQLGQFLAQKDQVTLSVYNTLFKDNTHMVLSEKFVKHLAKLSNEFGSKSGIFYRKLMKKVTLIYLKPYTRQLLKYREGALCSYCDWNNHNFISIDSLTVTYDIKFCSAILKSFQKVLLIKYTVLFRPLLILDEWFYLTSGRRLMKNGADRKKYKKYYNILKKCENGGGDVNQCLDVCREFNLNKFTSMFDGETTVISDYIKEYDLLVDDMEHDPVGFFGLADAPDYDDNDFFNYREKDSVLSNRIILDPAYLKLSRNEKYKLQFKHSAGSSFFEKKHHISPLQIESLEDEIDPLVLVKMLKKPIDLGKFLIIFNPKKGINTAKDSFRTNFKLKMNQLIALIHAKSTNTKIIDEIIEKDVKGVLKPITIQQVRGFVLDNRMGFNRLLYKKRYKKHMLGFKPKPLLTRLKYLVMDKIYSKWYGS